jgi:hypothetical protein
MAESREPPTTEVTALLRGAQSATSWPTVQQLYGACRRERMHPGVAQPTLFEAADSYRHSLCVIASRSPCRTWWANPIYIDTAQGAVESRGRDRYWEDPGIAYRRQRHQDPLGVASRLSDRCDPAGLARPGRGPATRRTNTAAQPGAARRAAACPQKASALRGLLRPSRGPRRSSALG